MTPGIAAVLLGLALVAAPLATKAQQAGKVYRIGYLSGVSRSVGGDAADVFLQELADLGYVQGQNLLVEERWAEGRLERLPDLAAELVRLNVDVIHVVATHATRAATRATKTIPIVFSFVSDPVGSGFVASLARPGGNVTGLTNINPELAPKQVELLKEAVPGLSHLAVLRDPRQLGVTQIFQQLQAAAPALGVTVHSFEVRDPDDFEPAFSAMSQKGAQAVYVGDTLLYTHRRRIADLALKHRLPTTFILPAYVEEGGLMSYAPSIPAMFRRAAQYADKILQGTRPSELPVEQPTTFNLVINLKTARALGLTIPPSLLVRADRVIE